MAVSVAFVALIGAVVSFYRVSFADEFRDLFIDLRAAFALMPSAICPGLKLSQGSLLF
ncbi:hypothetical protein [Paraburkholderia metrosideri]|jgi:hypothetical protein|uniref:hypothetical protein n=1 Tax=Paraburkholderia metrosideri TaxID=580937 RepID=UPI00191AD38C|nr:hypothetical protein [Paraburkholderia metrosideri]